MAQQNSFRLRQQRRRRLIVILLLLLMAGVAAYMLFPKQVNNIRRGYTIPERPIGQVAIPIVRQNLSLGTRLSQRHLAVRYLEPHDVPTDALIAPQQFVGRYTTRPLVAGNYLRKEDVAAEGAPKGFSGLVRPGQRVVVLSAGLFPGSTASLNVGDRIDLLSIGDPLMATARAGSRRSAADSINSMQGGGAYPGDPNAPARQRARARGATGANAIAATSATLIAENAEVMAAPGRSRDTQFVVLQMQPEDAHVTTLAAASGATMRIVFRPFNDEARLTPDKEAGATTRIPLPAPDPATVTIISGNQRSLQRTLLSDWDRVNLEE